MNQSKVKDGTTMDHVIELRSRLITCFLVLIAMTGVCYLFVDHILSFLIQPLADTMGENSTQRLIYTNLTEAFFTAIKISFLTALFLTLPVILNQIWKFVAPGLYAKEQRALLPFFVATPVLFLLGACLVYFFIMPLAWSFFLGFQTSGAETVLPIQLEAKIGDYLALIISLIFAFGLCFQLPVLLMLLARAGFVTADDLAGKRKYAIVCAFLVAAPLTPPDIISQTLLAIPLVVLFEISILLIRHVSKPA